MNQTQIITSATKAVKNAYTKTAALYGMFGALATGLYLNTQRIAESHVPDGIWNAQAWKESWADGDQAGWSLVGAVIVGLLPLATAPGIFKEIYNQSKTRTVIDRSNRTITQTSPSLFGKLTKSFDYDTIVSVIVSQGPLEKRANTGGLHLTAVSVKDTRDEKYENNSKLEEESFTIPYQEAPHDLRKKLFGDVPKSQDLKEALRSA
ncbi:MAG: hypothetical protein AABW51_01920 [Nanoarchaeota archaeon]